ncbi:putative bifunctional diguanylate cyclase/phosphodiesterase [Marinobacterium arenosum]|uniref:putative bifunctional diguanylate cyclase/phosphodiesterase n=1 Tax=Marinobacterium arenosum TaxID=2862496 RepID=UPI001C987236|nr:EAL domain-containing protein [Marinobacterium arenosum]MBY4676666.1 EAL domain-containing protein [Marinobacterium arenosum]
MQPDKVDAFRPHSPAEMDCILRLQREILEHIAANKPADFSLERICRFLERAVPGAISSIMLQDPLHQSLEVVCAPSVPESQWPTYARLIPDNHCARCDSCDNQPIPFRCPLARHRNHASDASLATDPPPSNWAFPIFADGDNMIGCVSLTGDTPQSPEPFHTRLLDAAAHLASIAIRREQIHQALRATTVRLQQITNALPGVVFQYRQDSDGHCGFSYLSRQSETLLGLDRTKLINSFSGFWQRLHPDDREPFNHSLQRSQQQQCSWQLEFRLFDDQGVEHWIQGRALPEDAAPDGSQVWNGILLDLTDSKANEQRLHLAATAFATTSEGILITDPDNRISDVNLACCRLFGYQREELIGQTPALLNAGHHDAAFFEALWQHLEQHDHWQGEIWNCHKNGEKHPYNLHIRVVRDEHGRVSHRVAVYADIGHLRASEEQVRYLTDHDRLTQLPNRSLFNQNVELWLKNQSTLAVLMLDLDRFKHINDALGHTAGDRLLTQVGNRLQQQLSPVDLLARIGGDEFAILLPMAKSAAEAEQVASRINLALNQPFDISGQRYFTTASIGIAIAPQHGSHMETLVRNAGTALHHAKKHGRDTSQLYRSELTERVNNWLRMEPELRRALDQQQFELYYQPQVEAASGRMIGAEALLRWCHPTLGVVSPNQFLPIAEEIGLIPRIGNWVLNSACAQLARWIEEGLSQFRLSINLAGPQISQPGLVERMAQLLQQYQLPPQMLELEILETFVMENEAQTLAVLDGLSELGIELALDDFGTGYSSLAYLKKLPISKVKIDQSLVHDIPNDRTSTAIASATVKLGKSLQLKTCAEGVENAAQQQFFQQQRCDQLQGYLFSQPLTADQLRQQLVECGRIAGEASPAPPTPRFDSFRADAPSWPASRLPPRRHPAFRRRR